MTAIHRTKPRCADPRGLLSEETSYQSTEKGERFVVLIDKQGVIPGIKLDLGVVSFAESLGEATTQGFGGLAQIATAFEKGE
ncbi:hypothetical protein TELCIR_16646, partial [Teladorsagia circumcincta]